MKRAQRRRKVESPESRGPTPGARSMSPLPMALLEEILEFSSMKDLMAWRAVSRWWNAKCNALLPECVFCGIKGPRYLEGPIKCIDIPTRNRTYTIHENCLEYSNRKNDDEQDAGVINRVIYSGMKCSYEKCKMVKRPSIGCVAAGCQNIYHLRCASLSECEIHGKKGLFCRVCVERAIEEKKKLIKWPKKCGVEYTLQNKWGKHRIYRDIIARYSHLWDRYPADPSYFLFFSCDLEDRTRVRQIFPGHWAWCPQLDRDRATPQYELVAAEDIEKKDWICEYTGKIKLHETAGKTYTCALYMPKTFPLSMSLCIDAEKYGNEARFINSVTPSSPPYIVQNATLTTVWCENELRVGVFATKNIKKNESIILDYNEYKNSYFKKTQQAPNAILTSIVFISKQEQYRYLKTIEIDLTSD